MTGNPADLDDAMRALAAALESMERRQADLVPQLSDARQQRRERLDARVEALLPDISDDTLESLAQEVPPFAADPKVAAAFEEHGKILWVIKPAGYDVALALLQAQLKLFLERQGLVSAEDQAIAHLEAEASALAKQQSEALAILRFVEQARRSGAPLRAGVADSIQRLAQRGRQLDAASRLGRSGPTAAPWRGKGAQRAAGQRSGVAGNDSDDDGGVWTWLLADVPDSLRTLRLDEPAQQRAGGSAHRPPETGGGDFAGAGASGDFGESGSPDESPAPAPAPAEAIATDDRLGTFS